MTNEDFDALLKRVAALEKLTGIGQGRKETRPEIVCPNGHRESFEESRIISTFAVYREGKPKIVNGKGEVIDPGYIPVQPHAKSYKCLTCGAKFEVEYS